MIGTHGNFPMLKLPLDKLGDLQVKLPFRDPYLFSRRVGIISNHGQLQGHVTSRQGNSALLHDNREKPQKQKKNPLKHHPR